MDEQHFLGDGFDKETLRQLSQRSDARGCRQLALHLALLGATGTAVWASRGSLWMGPAVVLHGIVLVFLFCALHETIHRTAFASRRANDGVAWACGLLLLLPRDYFRLFHFAHHRFTQDPTRDPEQPLSHPRTVLDYAWRASGLTNWWRRLTVTLRHALGRVSEPFVPAVKRASVVREARLLWACYAAILAVSVMLRRTDAWIYWILPVMAGQPFLRLYLLSEHIGCAQNGDAFANTRTTYTNAAVRFLTWQMPFHVEHHALPAIPFHALGKVNRLIGDRIKVSAPGYFALHRELLRQLRRARRPRAS